MLSHHDTIWEQQAYWTVQLPREETGILHSVLSIVLLDLLVRSLRCTYANRGHCARFGVFG